MGVVWEGTTKDWLKKLEKETDKAVGVAAETLVQEIQDSMPGAGASKAGIGKTARYTPSTPGSPPGVRTSRLKSSVSSQRAGKLKRVVGTNVGYAEPQHFGTSKMPARPFMVLSPSTRKRMLKRFTASLRRGMR